MKRNFTQIFLACLLLPLLLEAQVPNITNFSPTHGKAGTSVTVTGTNFSSVISDNVIWLGAVKCTVTAATSTQLTITIPQHASHEFFLYTNTANNLSCYSLKKFLVGFENENGFTYTTNSFGAAVSFTIGSISSNNAGRKYSLSDIDDDGKPDIVAFTGNSTTRSIYYLRNTATTGVINTSTFASTTGTPNTPANTSATYGHTVATDLNSDGKFDYIGSVVGYGGSSFYKNASTTGSPALTLQSTTPTSYTAMPNPFDINKDGKIDVLSFYNVSDYAYFWENTNALASDPLSFAFRSVSNAQSSGWTTGREADLDGDGLVDAVIGGYNNSNIYTYKNATATDAAVASFSFTVSTGYAISGTRPVDIRITDLDGDGKDEIITGSSSSGTLNIFPNQSVSGTITLGTRVDVATSAGNLSGIAIGDMNNDGKADIMVSGGTSLVYLENTSTGTGNISFASPVLLSASGGANLYTLELVDVDGDGRLDITGCGINGGSVKVFRNAIGDLTKFYLKNAGTTLTNLTDWTTSSNGVGGTSPADFGSDKEFILANRASYTLNAALSISGKLNLGSNMFTLGNFDCSAGSVSGGSASSYISTNGTGKFKVNVYNGSSVTIPVGNSAYNPVTITNNSGATDLFSVQVLDEVYADGVSGTTVDYVRVRRTWDIVKTNANAGSGVDLIFNWNSGETTTDFTEPKMCHYEGGNWVSQTGTTSVNATSLSYTGYTGTFSPFSIMNTNMSLPLRWINFSATLAANNTVNLEWQTADEINVRDFEIQWSEDGIKFHKSSVISAQNGTANKYTAIHTPPNNGKVFYRIKQTDIDGRFTYSPVAVVLNASRTGLKIFPNPVEGQINIYMNNVKSSNSTISISTTTGQEIYSKIVPIENNQRVSIPAGNWAPGLYNLKIVGADGSIIAVKQIMKK